MHALTHTEQTQNDLPVVDRVQPTPTSTTQRDGTPCIRSVQQQAFTVTASHPLTWADAHGATVRCLNVQESALLMGFAPTWKLPEGSRLGIHAVGNAVPPPMAAAIMRCAVESAHLHAALMPTPTAMRPPSALSDEAPASSSHPPVRKSAVSYAKYRSLKRRVEALEQAMDAVHTSMDEAPVVTSTSS